MTMTNVISERELITQLLKQFKKSPCLWDNTNVYYFNKQVRYECYVGMLDLWRKLEPNGTVQSLKQKLEHYRAAYRREVKKVESSILNAGDRKYAYVPRLWYYQHLTFLNSKMQQKDTSDEENETEYVHVPPEKKRRTSDSDSQDNTEQGKSDSQDYTTLYGLTIARQLAELDPSVRFEAERIISDVIYRARTGTLPKYTPEAVDNLVIPQCGPSWYDMPTDQTNNQTETEANYFVIQEQSEKIIKHELEDQEELN